jgi:Ca2+-binding EF-hand superfamily protein
MSVPEKDDVAKIIKGLKLDRAFFQDKVRYDPAKEERQQARRGRGKNKLDEKRRDFDIYLGEAVMPLCAQAIDALCRYITRQEERGAHIDPRMKARFNPCTWLAQYLLRSHPKFLTTPRRAGIYSGFSTWADSERGRRELIRRREDFERLFNGFAKKKRVSEETLPLIFQAADEMLYLQGEFSSHPALCADLRGKVDLSGSGSCDFASFWSWFTGLCMANDLLKYSTIERGEQLKAEEIRYLQEQERRQQERAIEKQRQADEIAQFLDEYNHLREECIANAELNRILHESQTLTGDLPPNGDPCYEDEIVPSGDHVLLLRRLVTLLGFPKKEKDLPQEQSTEFNGRSASKDASGASGDGTPARRGSKDAADPVAPSDPDLFWADDVADDWKILQEMIGTEMQDGVVDAQSLEAALPAPRAFLQLKRRVEEELERRRFEAHLDAERRRGEEYPDDLHEEPSIHYEVTTGTRKSVDVMAMQAFDGIPASPRPVETAKPSFESLCRQHRMTMARMHWLHAQFVDFLPLVGGVKQRCGYPENPAALTRNDVQSLMAEVKPDMTIAEFEQKFIQIDTDGSGELEFDEFVQWLGGDELELDAEADKTKPTKEDLAIRFKVSLERIDAIHEAFCSYLPQGEIPVDGYPTDPKALSKECIQKLVQQFSPDISDDEFDEQFRLIDMDNSESIEFDEFLEFLDFEEIQGSEPLSPTSPQ